MNGESWLALRSKSARASQFHVLAYRVAEIALQIATFWYFASVVHCVIVEAGQPTALQSQVFIAIMGSWCVCRWMADKVEYNTKDTLERDLEDEVHACLLSQQLVLTRKYSSAFWQQLFMTNVEDVGDFLTQYEVQKWLAGLIPLMVLVVIFPVNYIVGILLLLSLPLIPLFMVLVGKGAESQHRKHFVALERLGALFSDRLKGLVLITTNGAHADQLQRLDDASQIVNRRTLNVVKVAFLSTTVLDFFATICIALVAVFIGFSLLGEIAIGPSISLQQGLFLLLVTPLLFSELRRLGRYYHQKAKAQAGAERFEQVLAPYTQSRQIQASQTLTWLNFTVKAPLIQAPKLKITPHAWIHLSGESGVGKTALLEALMGFREATHRLNGRVALLPQNACILDKSVAYNLHLGRELTFSQTHLVEALQDVGLLDWFTNLPNGLATKLTDIPALSGGEAQRLALARVLLLESDIILLDEPTAHLSEEQHVEISALIHKQLQHKTVIWASHKPLSQEWFTHSWKITDHVIEVGEL